MVFSPDVLVRRYVYPVFFAKDLDELIPRMYWGTVIYAFLTLFVRKAPYGRYSDKKYGFGVPGRLAWTVQECPSFFVPMAFVLYGTKDTYRSLVNQLCLGMFVIHYFQRSFIFPFLMKSSKPTPFLPFFFAFLTCLYNGVLHGQYFTNYYQYSDRTWLKLPNFWIGFALFLFGMKINIGADAALRKLRPFGETGYKIPTGGWFDRITCPNYFGEIVEMWGYAFASLAPPAIAHALFTTIFLSRRALDHHEWYLTKFEDYPKDRKAVFPYLL
ncbi:3-oxo-5-alpha-steroid 4-dehydrogenase 1-like [Macrobrachium rosenbergii]|uniref:3-oxo-5-alpha-steroid 4-dehydrogenase 1-like n=1 Tax=Macrobrachium rosenbergii TaxID=79674 RepID=UPI0034D42361